MMEPKAKTRLRPHTVVDKQGHVEPKDREGSADLSQRKSLQVQDQHNSSKVSKGTRTPHIPILDFGKVQPQAENLEHNRKPSLSESQEKKKKVVDIELVDETVDDGQLDSPQ